MPQSADFDALAQAYDREFTHTRIGIMQRNRVRHFLQPFINYAQLNILEINCGTGEDALWLAARGHRVWASDISEEMIAVAKQKTAEVKFQVAAFSELREKYKGQQFDIIFSDFAGLNCINAQELKQLNEDFYQLLAPKGKLILVVLGKKCFWERMYFTLKGDRQKANRRQGEALAQLGHQATQPTFCYSVKELQHIFSSFEFEKSRPVGLFIPPSYLESWLQRFRLIVPLINLLELLLAHFSFFSDHADHTFVVFEKK